MFTFRKLKKNSLLKMAASTHMPLNDYDWTVVYNTKGMTLINSNYAVIDVFGLIL